MIFDIQKSNDKKIEEMYEKAMKELGEFFGMRWVKTRPLVIFLPDRKTYDLMVGEKTEDWEEGGILNSRNSIYIFPPDKLEKETSHKYSDESYFELIKHELSHLFVTVVFGDIAVWVDEGLAFYISGQRNRYDNPKGFNSFLESWDFTVQGDNMEMGAAVGILMDEFGKEKVLDFAEATVNVESEERVSEIFKDTFGIELSYEWFNKKLKES